MEIRENHFCDNLTAWSSASSLYNNEIAKLVTLADFQGKSTRDRKKKKKISVSNLVTVRGALLVTYSVFGKRYDFCFRSFFSRNPSGVVHSSNS